MDLCECICDPIFRLLRQIQANAEYCTDSDCLRELPDPQTEAYSQLTTTLTLAVSWVVVAGALYAMRPNSMRQESAAAEKIQANNNNNTINRSRDADDDNSGSH